MSVFDNIAFPLQIAKVPKPEIARRVNDVAKILQLELYLGRRPGRLSGGQRQRVAMGRAIIRRPSVFLMDEPLSNLDAKLRVKMRSEIAQIQRRARSRRAGSGTPGPRSRQARDAARDHGTSKSARAAPGSWRRSRAGARRPGPRRFHAAPSCRREPRHGRTRGLWRDAP